MPTRKKEKSCFSHINKEGQQQGFDEETKQKIQAYLEEIDRKNQQQQSSYQKTTGWRSYISFSSDKERKLLSFTGKFDKQDEEAKDFETGQVIPGKYVSRYSFECYDITDPDDLSELSIWQRGTRESRTVLYYLSKNKSILEVIRNGQPRVAKRTSTW